MKDAINLGRSVIAPYQPGEGFKKRHQRRFSIAVSRLPVLDRFCKTFKISFFIQGDNLRWTFIKDTHQIDWWPSTAKLVIDSQWDKACHCHDHWQVQRVLKQVFKI